MLFLVGLENREPLFSTDQNPFPGPSDGYVLDYIEIPKPAYRTEGSAICDTEIMEDRRYYRCQHHRDPDLLDFAIEHTYEIVNIKTHPLKVGGQVQILVKGRIAGYSRCCSISNYITARFESSSNKFTISERKGPGKGLHRNRRFERNGRTRYRLDGACRQ